jgi:hypothetical protein
MISFLHHHAFDFIHAYSAHYSICILFSSYVVFMIDTTHESSGHMFLLPILAACRPAFVLLDTLPLSTIVA